MIFLVSAKHRRAFLDERPDALFRVLGFLWGSSGFPYHARARIDRPPSMVTMVPLMSTSPHVFPSATAFCVLPRSNG